MLNQLFRRGISHIIDWLVMVVPITIVFVYSVLIYEKVYTPDFMFLFITFMALPYSLVPYYRAFLGAIEMFFWHGGNSQDFYEIFILSIIPLSILGTKLVLKKKNRMIRLLLIISIYLILLVMFHMPVASYIRDVYDLGGIFFSFLSVTSISWLSSFMEFISNGSSIGKSFCNLKVVKKDESKLTFTDILERNFLKSLGLLLFPISILYYIFKKELPWDYFSQTEIVRRRESKNANPPPESPQSTDHNS